MKKNNQNDYFCMNLYINIFIMKRTLLLFFVIAFTQLGFSQMWFPDGAVWLYGMPSSTPGLIGYNVITVQGDAVVNGVACRKLHLTREMTNTMSFPPTQWTETVGDRYLYEANNGDQVYLYDSFTNSFFLFLDFEAAINSTLTIPISNDAASLCVPPRGDVRIVSKGVETINGVTLKWIQTAYTGDGPVNFFGKVYQKIGAINAFFVPDFIPDVSDCGWLPESALLGNSLWCYNETGGFHYGQTTNYCDPALANSNFGYNNINIYNVNKDIKIELNETFKNVTVSLVDVSGKVVMTNKYNNPENIIDFDASNVATGIYIVKINADEKAINKKLVLN